MGNPWSPSNPSGTVILRLAENSLLHDEVVEFFNKQINVQPAEHLTYCTGPRGSRRLRSAAAALLNDDFQSKEIITADNILITPGVASAIDGLAWSICEDGDGILVPQPFYNGFTVDLLNRSNARVSKVRRYHREGSAYFEVRLISERKSKSGVTNHHISPHNPLGRCYPAETLRAFIRFCADNQLHFISDEIYAKSPFANPAIPSPVPFISTLSLDYQSLIDPSLVHILYGASKDFCANGIRLGLVCTKNEGIMGAMSSIGSVLSSQYNLPSLIIEISRIFSWSPHLLQDIWAAMLEDREWLEKFMTKKAELMAENYKIATTFCSDRGINYYEM
ncbi:unnamed protein product [Penicillium salamii]|uniref:Aminotransferase class I/classII large domain-containing protein n=1 Tax=Penicillium salamii TaxID=1612424 RepID=A0A9W4I9Y5_9EURO|nr:unnamed protein product [Penicillium salamii]CAG8267149.1 unnamed protein product [Penicillium salamii]CAG8378013.1 unnamed protein product [Penicillium salamii]CAG8425715.1 unnamed protein product [Penicillium salamii]